jgi:putative ABC transport system ATP-binding protein
MNSDRVLIAVDGVTKTYRRGNRDIVALFGTSLRVTGGEVVLIRGKSGSGKTTLLNILAGWENPDAGTVAWSDDFGAGGAATRTWQEVSVIPQALGLLAELPIDENVALPLRLGVTGGRSPGIVDELMAGLEIQHLVGRSIGEASLGEQQRAAIARALVTQPGLVLADEPTAHQDRARLDIVWSLLSEAATRGSSILVASHNPEAADHADRIFDLIDGKLIRA